MSHLYPLAKSARAVLDAPLGAALTRAEAERLAQDMVVTQLETEWLNLNAKEAEAMKAAADAGPGVGFVQSYEDADGATVLAVTYWKLADANAQDVLQVPEPAKAATPPPEEDHTDDLYFRFGRTRKRGSRKKVDPNQMDLFGKPEKG